MKKNVVFGLFLIFLASCAAIPTSPDAPKISNFVVPSKINVGVPYKVSFDFEDPNGDITEVYFAWDRETYLYPPGGWFGREDEKWMLNQNKGTQSAWLITRRPGLYALEVWVVDAKGYRSNRLYQSINVQ